jgi:hypothetical protein
MGGQDSRLIIAQLEADQRGASPGVAFNVEAKQGLFLQLHYFNSGNAVRDITGEVEFVLANTSGGTRSRPVAFHRHAEHQPAAASLGSSEGYFAMRPATGTRHVFALYFAYHKLGVRATIERVARRRQSGDHADSRVPWTGRSRRSRSSHRPSISMARTAWRLKCNYNNTTDQHVGFGTGVDQEMCSCGCIITIVEPFAPDPVSVTA